MLGKMIEKDIYRKLKQLIILSKKNNKQREKYEKQEKYKLKI